MKEIVRRRFTVEQIDVDRESSFLSKRFQNILRIKHITHNVPAIIGDKHPLGIVERWIRTWRNLWNRYKTENPSSNWFSILPLLVKNYNNSYHSTLKTEPSKAILNNEHYHTYLNNQFIKADNDSVNSEQIEIGDFVRTRILRQLFEKNTQAKFSKNVMKVESKENGFYKVSGRKHLYKREDLLKLAD